MRFIFKKKDGSITNIVECENPFTKRGYFIKHITDLILAHTCDGGTMEIENMMHFPHEIVA